MPVKNRILKRLTKQEALFVDEYFCNNFNAAAAYRKVYKVNDKKISKIGGYKVLNKPHIKFVIDKLWDELKDLNIIRRQELLIHLKEVLDNAVDTEDSVTILKTVDIINKMTGNYVQQIDATITGNINVTIPGLDITQDENNDEEEEETED